MKRRILVRAGMLLAVLALIVVLPAHLVVGQTVDTQSITVTVTAVPGYIYTPSGGDSSEGNRPATLPQELVVNTEGVFTQPAILYSDDSILVISFDEGTAGITGEGSPLKKVYIQKEGAIYFVEMGDEIYIREMESPPLPPEDSHIIGLVFEVGLDGTTFNPPVILSFAYDESLMPEGVVEEDLVIAWWDNTSGQWIPLDDCVVDTLNNIITAPVSHFTPFTILGSTQPVVFVASDLAVSPAEVYVGEVVNFTISVANNSSRAGSDEIILKVNDVVEAREKVVLIPGESDVVTLSTVKNNAGAYSVDVNGLTGSFTVNEKPVTPPEVSPPVTPLTPTPVPAPFPWWIIAPIMAGVAAIGSLYFFLYRRRQYAAVVGPAGVEAPVVPPSPIRAVSYPAIVASWRGAIVNALAKAGSAIVRWSAIVADQRGVIVNALAKAGSVIVRWSAVVADQRGVIVNTLAKAGSAIVRWSAVVISKLGLKK